MRAWLLRLAGLFQKDIHDRDFADELDSHV